MQPYSPLTPIRYKKLFQYITRIPNLHVYYPLWEQSGTVCRNYAPATKGSFNGTINGATVGQDGKVSKSYLFDGTNDDVSISGSFSADEATFFAIVNKDANVDTLAGIIFSRGAASNVNGLNIANSTTRLGYTWNDDYDFNSGISLTNGVWSLVAASVSSSRADVYLIANGTLSKAGETVARASISITNLRIGQDSIGARYWGGNIQHAGVVKRAMGQSEIEKMGRLAGLLI